MESNHEKCDNLAKLDISTLNPLVKLVWFSFTWVYGVYIYIYIRIRILSSVINQLITYWLVVSMDKTYVWQSK